MTGEPKCHVFGFVLEGFKEQIGGQCHVVGSVWDVSKKQLVEIVTFLARFWEVSKRQLVVSCRMSRIPRHGGWGMVQNWFTVFSNKLDTLYVTCAEAKKAAHTADGR